MDKSEKDKLRNALKKYFGEIYEIYAGGNYSEGSFYDCLKHFIKDSGRILGYSTFPFILPKRTEVGIPDFFVRKNGEIIGHIEAKGVDKNLENFENTEQLKRYREFLPNLILTNFMEFRLYRDGTLVDRVEVGRQMDLHNFKFEMPSPQNLEAFYGLLETFFAFSTPEIRNSNDLSIALVKRTRLLEGVLNEELSAGQEAVLNFYTAFRENLIETLTKDKFADLYAQTIAYGLFAAWMRMHKQGERNLKAGAWKYIPESVPLLREIFYSFVGPDFPASLTWIIDDIAEMLEKADVASIYEEFKLTKWEEDPVIHFYETFLATYNPEERQRLGVYYTPLPVVSYIVRSIHRILKADFGKEEGFASRDVTLLDPAAGTLTFVIQAIKQVKEELEGRRKGGLVSSYLEEHVVRDFHAFELLVAPYVIGHFRVAMLLEELGYEFKDEKRFKFFLTNTLELKEPEQKALPLTNLIKEAEEAKEVKEKIPIRVVLGNPPYSVSSENKSDFIEKLMEDYKEDVRKERNIQPLSDDYIKFIRFAHWKLDRVGKGILGFITNNSYLSGVIHRGMRNKLLASFDRIYILNLHGSSRIGEKTPEGGKDENVFDIQQGVTIALYVKLEKPLEEKRVFYADLWGLRSGKYKNLFENDVESTDLQELEPKEPYYFFVPKDFAWQEEYEKFWKVTEIFKEWSSGVKTHRDHFVVGFTKEEIVQRLKVFTGNLSDEVLKERLKLKDTGSWKLSEARQKVKGKEIENEICSYAYRPFDVRWICYESALIDRPRLPFMEHLLEENTALTLMRKPIPADKLTQVLIVKSMGDINFYAFQTYFFPLYLYPGEPKVKLLDEEAPKPERTPNFTVEFLRVIKEALCTEPTPEEIFYYIYAVLHSPSYRKRYEEFLKIDFPRVPLPEDYEKFKKLSELGKELVELHLLKHPSLGDTGVGFTESGSDEVEKVYYEENSERVWINREQYFDGISKEVWEYQIGAYRVMAKYLKDRKKEKRKLSLEEIEHYMRVAKAIERTREVQGKVEEVFEKAVEAIG
ncbi:MAG: N-6 DNA methylase [Methanophagales archaeon]|nr:N-6 DNA methylase [Methanophagales archaeon]